MQQPNSQVLVRLFSLQLIMFCHRIENDDRFSNSHIQKACQPPTLQLASQALQLSWWRILPLVGHPSRTQWWGLTYEPRPYCLQLLKQSFPQRLHGMAHAWCWLHLSNLLPSSQIQRCMDQVPYGLHWFHFHDVLSSPYLENSLPFLRYGHCCPHQR